jgi:ATP-dependent exoDNAse (exonuclease V) beta subunit
MHLHKDCWLGDFLNYLDNAFENDIPIVINKEEYTQNAIQLITLHGSKGREFEFVFMPHLIAKKWEGKKVNSSTTLPIDKNEDNIFRTIKAVIRWSYEGKTFINNDIP